MRQELPLPPSGTVVLVRARQWLVREVLRYEECALCFLTPVNSNPESPLALLLPFDRAEAANRRTRVARTGRRGWVSAFRERLAGATSLGLLRSAAPARIDLLPYQLEPALAALAGELRLLIADEVGLGKTIQAGLILGEVFARNHDARAFVLCPASLCDQWVAELQDRFHLPARRADAAALRELCDASAPGVSPWLQLSLPVVSFDYLKQPEVLATLENLQLDALVVDEAHMAALAVERRRLVQALARRAGRVILLTATPHAGDREGFEALCGLGRLADEPPLVVFRRSRSCLGFPPSRQAVVLRVRLSDEEREMHDALARYSAAVWHETAAGGGGADARLAMIVLRKRAASGPASLEASLARRLHALSSRPPGAPERQLLLPLDGEDDDAADEPPLRVMAAPGMSDVDAERRELLRLLDLSRAAMGRDSKARVLDRLLRRLREPAIVFTEYRDTLARLAELQHARRPSVLHGGMDRRARRQAVEDFTRGRSPLLLATDAAAHGLNLHALCRVVIDIELPWMPARLEQRIGRVDRIGQGRRVHALHLVACGTFEEEVLARLVLKIGRERRALGHAHNPLGAAGEMEVARLVFEEDHRSGSGTARACGQAFGEPPLPAGESVRLVELGSQAETEAARLRRIRPLLAASRHAPRDGSRPLWTLVRARRRLSVLPPGLVCLFVSRLADGRGCLLEETVTALHVALSPCLHAPRRLAAHVPELVAAVRDRVEATARELAAARRDEVQRVIAPWQEAVERREPATRRERPGEPASVQAGLFDRRAVKSFEERQRQRAVDALDASARRAVLEASRRVELAGPPELVLVLAVAR